MERRAAQGAGAERDRGGPRLPRTIRFTERDWERIETFAVMRGMTAAELVRRRYPRRGRDRARGSRFRRRAGPAGRADLPVHAHLGDRVAERNDRKRPRRGARGAGPLGPRAAG